jgi:hypothetical protein
MGWQAFFHGANIPRQRLFDKLLVYFNQTCRRYQQNSGANSTNGVTFSPAATSLFPLDENQI